MSLCVTWGERSYLSASHSRKWKPSANFVFAKLETPKVIFKQLHRKLNETRVVHHATLLLVGVNHPAISYGIRQKVK